jgi:hypothetical protein
LKGPNGEPQADSRKGLTTAKTTGQKTQPMSVKSFNGDVKGESHNKKI